MNQALPPLPLTDGALFIDNSTLEDLMTCPRAMQYRFLHKRVLAVERPSLNFGKAIHEALAVRYKGGTEAEMHEALRLQYEQCPAPPDDFRTLALAMSVVSMYAKVYEKEPFEVVRTDKGEFVEFPFAHKLFDADLFSGPVSQRLPVYYCGKVDLAVSCTGQVSTSTAFAWTQGIWVVDHKTSSIFGEGVLTEHRMSAQMLGYCWGFWKATGIMPIGFRVNLIRVRPATKNTKYAEITGAEGERQVRADDFNRDCYLHINEEMLREWERNTIALVEEFLWAHGRDYMPQKRKWCVGKFGKCSYLDVCQLPEENRGVMLSSMLYQDNDWSPLNQTK